jgi:hypothetical protein
MKSYNNTISIMEGHTYSLCPVPAILAFYHWKYLEKPDGDI